EGVAVAEGQRGGTEFHARAGFLGEEVDPDRAGVGELEGELVGVGGRGRCIVAREHSTRGLLEAERDGVTAFGERLAGAQLERDARPALVVDLYFERGERLDGRAGCHAWLCAVAVVLTVDDPAGVDRLD